MRQRVVEILREMRSKSTLWLLQNHDNIELDVAAEEAPAILKAIELFSTASFMRQSEGEGLDKTFELALKLANRLDP